MRRLRRASSSASSGAVGEALECAGEQRVRFVHASEADERLGESRESSGVVRRHLDEALVLNERFLDQAEREEQTSEVRARRTEAGIDAQCLVVVRRRAIGPALALFENTERVMGLRNVGVDAPRAFEELARAREVSALHLDDAEVHECVDEAGAVLERYTETSVGRFEIAAGERVDSGVVERKRSRRQRHAGRAADEESEGEQGETAHEAKVGR